MSVTPINKGIFNGLESLEVLVMDGAYLKVIENGVLDVLNETLKQFTLIASSKYWSEILIDGFTGSEPLKALENVKYNYNLKSTLSRKSFVGLTNVKTLDLSDCQIVTIGAGAFDPISSSITELNLKNNLITTLPEGLFADMLLNPVRILLDGNKWDCDCHLIPFKIALMESSNFVGTFQCSTPRALSGYSIIDTDFCDSYVPPPTTTTQSTLPTTTTTTTTATTSTPTTSNSTPTTDIPSSTVENTTPISTEPSTPEEFMQTCYAAGESELSKTVVIKTPRAGLTANENEYGDVIVDVDTLTENSVLIWFSLADRDTYYTANDEIACVIGTTTSIPVNNLRDDTAYTFCLMDSSEKTVSPLDCISYTKRHIREQPWLLDSSKSLIISMLAVACSISVLVGLAVGRFVWKTEMFQRKTNQNRKHNACINEVLKETFQSNSIL